MRIIARKPLREFWKRHRNSEDALRGWYKDVKGEEWKHPTDILKRYPNASIVGSDRVVFRIKGNRYRLIAIINYASRTIYVRFVGTHAEYNRVKAEEV